MDSDRVMDRNMDRDTVREMVRTMTGHRHGQELGHGQEHRKGLGRTQRQGHRHGNLPKNTLHKLKYKHF